VTPGALRKWIALASLCFGLTVNAAEPPYIVVLGIAQDAGYPQANCYRPHCMRAWENPSLRRLTSSIAVVDGESKTKYLFDATPDIREQLYQLHLLAPDDSFSLDGIFLTHGHMGHYTGLMHFGYEATGAKDVPVYVMPRMSQYLSSNGPWDQMVNYGNIQLREMLEQKQEILSGRLKVTPLRVPHREEYTEAVGYRIEGPEKSALFIPDIDKWERWDTDIVELIRSVDYALLDGSFFADGELPGRAMENIPHPFVSESMTLFSSLNDEEKSRVIFIHFNHTNPLLIEGSKEQAEVERLGFRFASEGMKLPL
jgi:pyrroloquinoline quinone biosynthesis protein B